MSTPLSILTYYRRWRQQLTPGSTLTLMRWMRRRSKKNENINGRVTLSLHAPVPGDLTLREAGTDFFTFREVMVDEVYAAVVEHLGRCESVIDLGGNIGLATYYLSHKLPDAKFLCVEPFPGNFELLEKNLAKVIASGQVQLQRAAVWSHREQMELPVPEDGGFSRITLTDQGDAKPESAATFAVDAMTMNDLMDTLGTERVGLVKMDIEGAETPLLQADSDWFAKIDAIAIEFHGDSRQESGFDALIEKHGMKVVAEDDHTVLAKRV